MANEQAEFWSNVAKKYDRVVDLQIGGQTRAMVRERVARERHLGRLVEFGCGTGFYTEVLARAADTVLATDISPGMLELAKLQVKASNVTFEFQDCQQTSLADGVFDAAFLSLVIVPVRVLWTVSRPSHAAACIFARTSRGVQWS